MSTHYDMVISGGGLVGAALGLSLAHLPLSIAVIDPTPVTARTSRDDDRTYTLSLGTKRALATLGVWPLLPAASTNPIRRIHVSDLRGRFGFTHLDAEDIGVEALGYVTESGALWDALRAALARTEVTWIQGRFQGYARQGQSLQIAVDRDGELEHISGQLLVGADGTGSAVRAAARIGTKKRSYEREVVVVNCQVTRPQPNTAFERFAADGPVAALPTARDHYTLVISQRHSADLLGLPDEAFCTRVHDLFGDRLGSFTNPGRRLAFPLALMEARTLIGDGVVLVGNAAHTLHPVAGQGFNLGLRDAAHLADHLAYAVEQSRNIGDADVLTAYAQARRADIRDTISFTDGLVRLFAIGGPFAGALRNLALTTVDCLPSIKRALARQTMGLKGPLPAIVRGLRP